MGLAEATYQLSVHLLLGDRTGERGVKNGGELVCGFDIEKFVHELLRLYDGELAMHVGSPELLAILEVIAQGVEVGDVPMVDRGFQGRVTGFSVFP